MTFNCGDIVTLLPTSRFASSAWSSNPVGIEGIVFCRRLGCGDLTWYDVAWSNGETNNYTDEDLNPLMVYSEETKEMINMLYPGLLKEAGL